MLHTIKTSNSNQQKLKQVTTLQNTNKNMKEKYTRQPSIYRLYKLLVIHNVLIMKPKLQLN